MPLKERYAVRLDDAPPPDAEAPGPLASAFEFPCEPEEPFPFEPPVDAEPSSDEAPEASSPEASLPSASASSAAASLPSAPSPSTSSASTSSATVPAAWVDVACWDAGANPPASANAETAMRTTETTAMTEIAILAPLPPFSWPAAPVAGGGV